MDKKIIIKNVEKNLNTISLRFDTEGNIQKFFNTNVFTVEYDEAVDKVTNSIAIIPFMCNVLPIAFVLDISIFVEEIDETFYNCIDDLRNGYKKMCPNLELKGKIIANKIVKNIIKDETKNTIMLFSGGVDAFATFYKHLDEKPILATVRGADITTDDYEGWKVVSSYTHKTAKDYNLISTTLTSNFKEFINHSQINTVSFEKINYDWWYAFQHGIGMIGLLAPLCELKGIDTIYIASSYTSNQRTICASNPYTDESLKFLNCNVVHDQYDVTRQQKIDKIVNITKDKENKPILRVCWQFNSGGKNCCSCEKCYRTIYGLLAANSNPNDYGFEFNKKVAKRISYEMQYKLFLSEGCKFFWKDIQQSFKNNRKDLEDKKEFKWIYKMDFDKINEKIFKRLMRKIKRSINPKLKQAIKNFIKNENNIKRRYCE